MSEATPFYKQFMPDPDAADAMGWHEVDCLELARCEAYTQKAKELHAIKDYADFEAGIDPYVNEQPEGAWVAGWVWVPRSAIE